MTQYEAAFNDVMTRLTSTRRKENIHLLTVGLFKTLFVGLLAVFAASLIELAAHGDTLFRTVLAGIVFLGFAVPAGIYLFPAVLRSFGVKNNPTLENIALRVGNSYPEIKDKLCNAIQLFSSDEKKYGVSRDLTLAAFDTASNQSKGKDFSVIIDKDELKRTFFMFLGALIVAAGTFLAFGSSVGSAFGRIANFNQSYLPPAPFSITIEPQSAAILRGEKTEIKVKATGTPPDNVTLHLKEKQQENYDEYTLRLENDGDYVYEIPSLKRSVSFYASAEWLSSMLTTKVGNIEVIDRPMIRAINGRVIYPSYTDLASKSFNEQNADITALKGSRVDINAIANKDLKSAEIVLIRNVVKGKGGSAKVAKDTTTKALKIEGRKANGSFRVTSSGNYYISVEDTEGMKNDGAIRYGIIAMNDAYPTISMVQPTFDVKIGEDAMLQIITAISDDYGFSSLKLHYRLAESRYIEPDEEFSSIEIPFNENQQAAEVPYLWDLNEVDIAESDRYEFYLEVADNDIVNGPKTAKTQVLSVRLPSLDEVMKDTDQQQENIQRDLQKVMKEANEINKELKEFDRELLKKSKEKKLDWKDKKKAEDIMKKQQELQEKLSDVQKDLQKLTEKMQEHKILSQETMQKFMELQDLMKQVNSPELERMQREMENAMKNVPPEEMRKAMEKVKFDEERFRKSIERTMKIMKRLQAEQKVDALTKQAEEMAKKQKDLEKQMENANPNDKSKTDELSKKQDKLTEDFDKMTKELEDLKKMMQEIGDDMPMEDLDKAKQELKPQETRQQMQQASSQCKSGNMSGACQNQSKASQNMKKFAQQMQQMKQKMQRQSQKEAMRKMSKAVSDMLKLSEEQEALKQKTQSSDYNSTMLPQFAKQQAEMLQSMQNVANSMLKLSEKSFAFTPEMGKEMGDAMRQMQQSMQELSERRTNSAAKAQSGAMSSLNNAVNRMKQMMSMMQNQGSGACQNPGGMGQGKPGMGSFGEQLQKLAAQQKGINQAIQQMSQNRGGLSQEQRAKMKRLGKQQGNAGKSMRELAREQDQKSGERKSLGDLNKIAEEMEEVVKDIESGDVTPETLEKQERILSRLLDANRSIHERDFEKERKSKAGKDYDLQSPGEIDFSTQEGKTRALQELLNSIKQGYTKDYEILIQKYFESLQGKEIYEGQ